MTPAQKARATKAANEEKRERAAESKRISAPQREAWKRLRQALKFLGIALRPVNVWEKRSQGEATAEKARAEWVTRETERVQRLTSEWYEACKSVADAKRAARRKAAPRSKRAR